MMMVFPIPGDKVADKMISAVRDLRASFERFMALTDPSQVTPVVRILRWFEKGTEELAGSAPLRGIQLHDLQRMFSIPADNPMYDCYPVTSVQASQLQAYVDVPLLLDRYDHFVEADAIGSRTSTPEHP